MIKSNELRIGNIFHIRTSSCGFHKIIINGITKEGGINPSLGSCDCTIEDLEPILLTPEILEGCGFERKVYKSKRPQGDMISMGKRLHGFKKINVAFNAYYPIQAEIELDYSHMKINFTPSDEVQHVTQLHQLQNLYFALTGEELTVNLNVAITI